MPKRAIMCDINVNNDWSLSNAWKANRAQMFYHDL